MPSRRRCIRKEAYIGEQPEHRLGTRLGRTVETVETSGSSRKWRGKFQWPRRFQLGAKAVVSGFERNRGEQIREAHGKRAGSDNASIALRFGPFRGKRKGVAGFSSRDASTSRSRQRFAKDGASEVFRRTAMYVRSIGPPNAPNALPEVSIEARVARRSFVSMPASLPPTIPSPAILADPSRFRHDEPMDRGRDFDRGGTTHRALRNSSLANAARATILVGQAHDNFAHHRQTMLAASPARPRSAEALSRPKVGRTTYLPSAPRASLPERAPAQGRARPRGARAAVGKGSAERKPRGGRGSNDEEADPPSSFRPSERGSRERASDLSRRRPEKVVDGRWRPEARPSEDSLDALAATRAVQKEDAG
ncbi:hypothetical protein KM043_007350 [Ampulex compressa]|nr:hypothetical protein KM043_007350 [Ampulex compressa]